MKKFAGKFAALLLVLLCLTGTVFAQETTPFADTKLWYDETLIHVDLIPQEEGWEVMEGSVQALRSNVSTPRDDRKLTDPTKDEIAALLAVTVFKDGEALQADLSSVAKIATFKTEEGQIISRVSIDLLKVVNAADKQWQGNHILRKVSDIRLSEKDGALLFTMSVDEMNAWDDFVAEFRLNFIKQDRWKLLLVGLENTLLMTAGALLIGIVIGIVVAVIRSVWETNGRKMRGVSRFVLRILDKLCLVYTTVIRGTPMVVQLLILYYIVFASYSNGLVVAMLSFGINSGAYVAEIFRSGILSIDKGQMEAGRSIGLSYVQTMWYIIAPQVLKNVLPTLANEFITLIKETSIAGYVAVQDLTFAGNRIRGVTYSAFMPLIAVALIYLVLVTALTWLVGKFERRLRQGDNR